MPRRSKTAWGPPNFDAETGLQHQGPVYKSPKTRPNTGSGKQRTHLIGLTGKERGYIRGRETRAKMAKERLMGIAACTPLEEAFIQALVTPDADGNYRSASQAYQLIAPGTPHPAQEAYKMRIRPPVKRRIEIIRSEIRERIMSESAISQGVGNAAARLAAKNKRWFGLQEIINERAKDPEVQDVPGGKTGLIVYRDKPVDGEFVREYVIDETPLSELRALEDSVAKELGQVAPTRSDITSGGSPISSLMLIGISSITDAELDERIRAIEQNRAITVEDAG